MDRVRCANKAKAFLDVSGLFFDGNLMNEFLFVNLVADQSRTSALARRGRRPCEQGSLVLGYYRNLEDFMGN